MNHQRLYIGGEWVLPDSPGDAIPVVNPATGQTLGEIPRTGPADAARAAAAARAALPGWSATAPAVRAEYLSRLCSVLEARVPEIARTVAQEVGTPI
jgi:aldehyde dehydrogenase (NAD+)